MEEYDWTQVEEADYMVDMETNTLKRKRMRGKGSEACYIPKSDRFDEDYVLFLEGLEEFWESKFNVHEEDNEEDDDDPLYLAFLDNLEVHRNAYKCCVSVKYGVLSPIVYEKESDYVPVKRKLPKSNEGTYSRVKKKVNFDAKTHHFDGVKVKKTTISNEGGFVSSEKKKVGENLRTNLEHSIPQDGFSDGYKRSSEGVVGLNRRKHRNRHISVGKGRTKFPSRRGGSNGGVDVKGDRRSGSVYSSCGEQASLEVNDTYKQFVDNLYVEAGCLFFKYGDNKKIVYECDDEQTTEDEIGKSPASPKSTLKEGSGKPRRLNPSRRPTQEPSISIQRPATPPSREKASTTANSHMLSTSACKAREKFSRFPSIWDELHDLLTKPYMQKEYDDLMEYVSVQKPVEIHRDSRSGGSKRYGGLGKSYLQHYKDLNAEIKKVGSDRHKVLNLLRMFKVYIMKCPCGIPKPWEEEYFKAIMPGQKLHGST